MRNIGWILVLCLGMVWAYLDIYGAEKIPLVKRIIELDPNNQSPQNPQNSTNTIEKRVEAGYVPGKSPDAHKAKEHIVKKLNDFPEQGNIEIISQKILVSPRKDGTWTEEWIVRKGNTEIPIKIDFGISGVK